MINYSILRHAPDRLYTVPGCYSLVVLTLIRMPQSERKGRALNIDERKNMVSSDVKPGNVKKFVNGPKESGNFEGLVKVRETLEIIFRNNELLTKYLAHFTLNYRLSGPLSKQEF